jgi:hypothetical protein
MRQSTQRLGDALAPFAGFLRSQPIFVKGEFLRGMFEADRRLVPIMRPAPRVFSLVVAPMAQHHRLHLQSNSQPLLDQPEGALRRSIPQHVAAQRGRSPRHHE